MRTTTMNQTYTFASLLRSILLALVATITLSLAGCGGGSGTATTTKVGARVVVDWPDLTRRFEAPGYAKSAVITISSSASTPVSWTVDRGPSPLQQVSAYTSPEVDYSVPATLTLTFKAGSGGTGSVVATAAANVTISPSGTVLDSGGLPLGSISYSTTLTSLEMGISEVAIGATQAVVVNGRNTDGIVALPQALVGLTVTNNPQNVDLTNGNLTGLFEGTSDIQATYDGLSTTATVNVTPKVASHTLLSFRANRIAWDSGSHKFWGTFGTNSAYPNSIVDIDPATGAIGTPIHVGSEPSQIGISSDGTIAYVGLNGASSIRVVDLVGRSAGATISIESFYLGGIVTDIKFNPSNKQEVSVCLGSSTGQQQVGPIIYRNDLPVNASSPGQNTAAATVWTGSTTLVGFQEGGANNIYRVLVSANSVDFTDTVPSANQHRNNVALAGDNMYLDNGDYFHSGFLTYGGKLHYGQESYDRVETDSNGNQAWMTVEGSYPRKIRCFNLADGSSADVQVLPFGTQESENVVQMMRFGNTGMAVLSTEGLYILPFAPALF